MVVSIWEDPGGRDKLLEPQSWQKLVIATSYTYTKKL